MEIVRMSIVTIRVSIVTIRVSIVTIRVSIVTIRVSIVTIRVSNVAIRVQMTKSEMKMHLSYPAMLYKSLFFSSKICKVFLLTSFCIKLIASFLFLEFLKYLVSFFLI